MLDIPINHFHHLMRLADLRRCAVDEAIRFLFKNVAPHPDNWIDQHFGFRDEVRRIPIRGIAMTELMERIQGLPRNIRPVTDGPYLKSFSFFTQDSGLLGIEAEGVKILDFEMATRRDREVYALVQDLLPAMTVEQFRVYNTFNSQYLRLVREPDLFTMPKKKAVAIDAGCYVGYKALAMAQFVGKKEVLAFELAEDNFDVLKLNARNNPQANIVPFRAALSDKREPMQINTRNPKTMAHSLTRFDELKEAQTSLLNGGQRNLAQESILTSLLDDFTKPFGEISAVHISVNGHEPELCRGAIETLKKAEISRISCPYKRSDRSVFDIVVDILKENHIPVFGRSGAAVIAGKKKKSYHAVPLSS